MATILAIADDNKPAYRGMYIRRAIGRRNDPTGNYRRRHVRHRTHAAPPSYRDLSSAGNSTFAPVGGAGYEIKGKETDTLWNAVTGRAIEGPILNKSLDKLPFTPAFWFGWKDNYPDTLVYGERR